MQSNGMPEDQAHEVYRQALASLIASGVPFLVGGAFGLESYTGLVRRTKDLDLFVRSADRHQLMDCLSQAGFQTEWRFSHWLGKAWKQGYGIDVIFSSGNGLCIVDDLWFQHASPAVILGFQVKVIPAEEMLWSKAFVMERHRYDGGDIAHLLRARVHVMDWARLLRRFNGHWRVLFSHVLLFGYIYPAHRLRVPEWFMQEMLRRVTLDMQSLPADPRVCQGTLLSWSQYLVHMDRGEYEDARHLPRGSLTWAETRRMTEVLTQELDAP